MSRNDPPTAPSGSWPSTRPAPAWFARTFATACGRWLVMATRRSWAPGSIATGRAPSPATNPCTVRWWAGSVAAVGVRNHVAPWKRSARAFATPRASDPHTGWPPTKRGLDAAADTSRDFVEPTSVTAHPSPVAATVCSTSAGRWTTGPHTTATSASATAPSSVSSTRAAAPRSRPTRRRRDPGRTPTTSSPRPAAASPIDPPMRPSPTIPRRIGYPSRAAVSCAARMSSARRNARSSDWRAFRRGSHSVR